MLMIKPHIDINSDLPYDADPFFWRAFFLSTSHLSSSIFIFSTRTLSTGWLELCTPPSCETQRAPGRTPGNCVPMACRRISWGMGAFIRDSQKFTAARASHPARANNLSRCQQEAQYAKIISSPDRHHVGLNLHLVTRA